MNLLGLIGGEGGQSLNNYIFSIPNLVAYYPLDETSGNAINRAPATYGGLNGTLTSTIQGTQGQRGLGYTFDGANSVVNMSPNSSFDITTNFSGFALIKPNSFGEGNAGRIFNKMNAGLIGYDFVIVATNSVMRLIKDTDSNKSSDNSTITTGVFQMVGFSYDGANIYYYKNGALVGSPASTQNATTNAENFSIGNRPDQSRTFDGIIQHVGLVNRVMTIAEHLRLAQLAGLA